MKSPINVSIKSYVNFGGTGSQGNHLLALSKKSWLSFKGFPLLALSKNPI